MDINFSSLTQPEMKITELVADADNLRVKIAARQDGVIAMILHLIGISGTASISGDVEGCLIERTTFWSQSRTYVSWGNVSASFHTVTKAAHYLAAAVPMLGLGIAFMVDRTKSTQPMGIIFLGLALILFVLVLAKRSVLVGILTSGGKEESIKLKGSRGEMAELKEVMRVMEMLNRAASEDARR